MIKIGQSIHPEWISGDLNRLDEELKQIKEAGADCCELVLHGLDVVIGGRVILPRMEALLSVLKKHGLEYTLHMPHGLNLLEADMLEINLGIFRSGIEFAQAANIKLINFHAGKTKSDDKALIHKEMEQIKLLAANSPDILFCLENPLFFRDDEFSAALNAGDMIEFCEQVGLGNFKLTFDIGHNFLRHNGNADALLGDMDRLLPYAGHIHLHDNCGIKMEIKGPSTGHRLVCGIGDIHLPLGWGRIPLDSVFARLKAYDGIINLEIEQRFSDHYSECLSLVREKLGSSPTVYKP